MKWWIWKAHWILQDFAQLPKTDILIFHGRASKWRSKTVRPCQRIKLQTQAVHNLNQRWKWTRTSWEGKSEGKKNDKPFKRTASATENSAAVVDKLGWQDCIYRHCTHTHKKPSKNQQTLGQCARMSAEGEATIGKTKNRGKTAGNQNFSLLGCVFKELLLKSAKP